MTSGSSNSANTYTVVPICLPNRRFFEHIPIATYGALQNPRATAKLPATIGNHLNWYLVSSKVILQFVHNL